MLPPPGISPDVAAPDLVEPHCYPAAQVQPCALLSSFLSLSLDTLRADASSCYDL